MNKVKKLTSIFWLIVFIAAIHNFYYAQKNKKEYLLYPAIGDIYVTKIAYINGSGFKDFRLVGLMKLISIDGVFFKFKISTTATNKRGSLYLINKYSENIICLSIEEVYELYDKGIIEEIRRN